MNVLGVEVVWRVADVDAQRLGFGCRASDKFTQGGGTADSISRRRDFAVRGDGGLGVGGGGAGDAVRKRALRRRSARLGRGRERGRGVVGRVEQSRERRVVVDGGDEGVQQAVARGLPGLDGVVGRVIFRRGCGASAGSPRSQEDHGRGGGRRGGWTGQRLRTVATGGTVDGGKDEGRAVERAQSEVQKVRHARCLQGAECVLFQFGSVWLSVIQTRWRPTNIFKRKHLQKITKNQESDAHDDVATWPYSAAPVWL